MKTGERPATTITTPRANVSLSAEQVIADYRIAVRSRAASELGRREVLVGRAPFGIFGDGKEVANLGLAHAFRPGDWRSGYYRDQTFHFAVGLATGLGALAEQSTVTSNCDTTAKTCNAMGLDAAHTGQALAVATDVLGGLGLVSAAVGVVLLVTSAPAKANRIGLTAGCISLASACIGGSF
jgi:TPP-dependent pyruvate/acetoin dehydrogenase alpha subunit